MKLERTETKSRAIKLFLNNDAGREIARAYLYLVKNDLNEQPYGLLEDVYVDESLRGQGYGTKLVKEIIAEAKRQDCYKLIATSRFEREKVHELYKKLGFVEHGIEFRMNL